MVTAKQSRLLVNALILANRKIYFFVIYDIESIMNNILILENLQGVSKSVE